jgi:hypothetical protein
MISTRGLRTVATSSRAPVFLMIFVAVFVSAASGVAQRLTKTLLFDGHPSTVYTVSRNGSPLTSTFSSQHGVVTFTDLPAPGDLWTVEADSTVDTQPPSPPLIASAEESGPNCLSVSWFPVGDPTVVGYEVGYGPRSLMAGDVSAYDHTVEVGNATLREVCGLQGGTQYVAVRAVNHLGIRSAYSAELPVEITPTAVLITGFEATVDGMTVRLAWDVFADESLSGFRVFRGEGGVPGRGDRIHGVSTLPVGTRSILDETVQTGTQYRYTLVVVRADGTEAASLTRTIWTNVWGLELEQNSPNPFNPQTTITFVLPSAVRTRLDVFDVKGGLVVTLLDQPLAAGRHTVRWNGVDRRGAAAATGTYFYRLTAGKKTMSRKMLLLK